MKLEQIQQVADATPTWANWLIIGGSWAVSILQPLALLVTVAWGGLQIFSWWEKRRKKRKE
ncbi:MAG TPA: hypothetical protein VGK99_05465 [Acidobacteriota bacterium]|jgi:hypothetical protein